MVNRKDDDKIDADHRTNSERGQVGSQIPLSCLLCLKRSKPPLPDESSIAASPPWDPSWDSTPLDTEGAGAGHRLTASATASQRRGGCERELRSEGVRTRASMRTPHADGVKCGPPNCC